ncbi:MAG: hypothetical protein VYE15_03230 [Myxococcota bacterium]|nr:hypothetical protein [Myxococcota bacterium]
MRAKAPRDPRGRRRTVALRWLITFIGVLLFCEQALASVDTPAPPEAPAQQEVPATAEAAEPNPDDQPTADPEPTEITEPPPALPEEEPAAVDKRVLGSFSEGGALSSAWSEVRSDLERKAWTEAMGRLPHLVEMRDDLGYPSLEPMSAVLLHAARSAADHGALEGAHTLAEAAATLSPAMASPHVATAAYSFARSPFSLTPQLQGLRSAGERLADDLPSSLVFYGNGLMAVMLIVLGILGLYGLAMLARYRRLIASDLRRILPRGVSELQALLLVAALSIAPALAGLGLVVTAVVWLVLSAPFQNYVERLITGGLLVAITAFPTLADHVVRTVHYPMTPDATIARCLNGPCAPDDQARLKSWAETGVLPYETYFTLATIALRDSDRSLERLAETQGLAEKALEAELNPAALTLMGNIMYRSSLDHCPETGTVPPGSLPEMMKVQEEAVALWMEAARRAPQDIAPLYNAHAVLRQMNDHEGAEPLQARILALDTWGVVAWNKEVAQENNTLPCRLLEHPNRHLMPPPSQTSRLFSNVISYPVAHDGLIVPLPGLVAGRFGSASLGLAGPAGVLLLALLWLVAVLIRPSSICKNCEGVARPGTSLEVPDGSICESCLLQEMRKGTMDARDQWQKERSRQSELWHIRWRVRVATWGLPGFGHLLRGAPVRGCLLLVAFVSSMVLMSGIHVVVFDPRVPVGNTGWAAVLLGLLGGLSWLAAVVDVHTGKVAP